MRSTRLLAVAAVLLTAGCTSVPSVSNRAADTGSNTSAKAPAAATSAAAKPSSSAPAKAGVGSAIDLKGMNGEKIRVTLVKVFDPAKSTNQFLGPKNGQRYVGFQFRIANTGTSAFSDDPLIGIKAADASGQEFACEFMAVETDAGAPMQPDVKLTAGNSVLGIVVVPMPAGDKPVRVRYTVGFAGGTGEWTLS